MPTNCSMAGATYQVRKAITKEFFYRPSTFNTQNIEGRLIVTAEVAKNKQNG